MTFNKRIITEFVTGSHLYGMATPNSDLDLRGVCLEDEVDIYGLGSFEQFEDPVGDRVIYGLRNFFKLARDSNPNIIEFFFVKENRIENARMQRLWTYIQSQKYFFISRRVTKTFAGYVTSQRKRMDTHYRWMMGNPPVKPKPEDYGQYYKDGTPKWSNPNLKSQYENLLKDYQSYETWETNRNKTRHDTEKKYGYDTKHGSHIFRLLEEVDELHHYGTITFPRPDAENLKYIRNGGVSYEQLNKLIDAKIDYINNVAHPNSVLPEKHNQEAIEDLLINIYRMELRR